MKPLPVIAASLLLALPSAALDVDVSSTDSIKETAATIAYGLVKYYRGNETGGTPGTLPEASWYWWIAGGMFGHLIDYWYYTGDSTYNDITLQAMMHQINAPIGDFLPANQSSSMGNDDQGYWAMTSMMAAEAAFPNPPADTPQWLAGAQAVFNEYVLRWEEDMVCGGGLRWQIWSLVGHDYKNTVSNGCFFNIAARLARFTRNDTYAEWATKIYEWQHGIKLIDDDNYAVYDGIDVYEKNKTCGHIHPEQWSYNSGIWLAGSAAMHDYTKKDIWKTRVDGLLNFTQGMFLSKDGNHMWEPPCEKNPPNFCNYDQKTFKGYLIRFLAFTAKTAPWTFDTISKILQQAAKDAAAACSGPKDERFAGHDGTACGFGWLNGDKYDGLADVGPQMNALAAVYYNLQNDTKPPATNDDRGTSKGDPGAGRDTAEPLPELKKIVTADRAGAAILTVLFTVGIMAATFFLVSDVGDGTSAAA